MLTFDERVAQALQLRRLLRDATGAGRDFLKSDAELEAEVRGEMLAAAEARGRAHAPAHAASPKPAAPVVLAAPAPTKPARPAGGGNAALFEMARIEALRVIARDAARGWYLPQAAIADEVAAELRKRGLFGADGKPLTGTTIKRHALKGISSATKEARLTARTRGK